MKHLKRLQKLEKVLIKPKLVKSHEEEFTKWIRQHPLEEMPGSSFDFNKWMDQMPCHLISCFQSQVIENISAKNERN